jgi:hypothetical protein
VRRAAHQVIAIVMVMNTKKNVIATALGWPTDVWA